MNRPCCLALLSLIIYALEYFEVVLVRIKMYISRNWKIIFWRARKGAEMTEYNTIMFSWKCVTPPKVIKDFC